MYIAIHLKPETTLKNASNLQRRQYIKYNYINGTASHQYNESMREQIHDWINEVYDENRFIYGVDIQNEPIELRDLLEKSTNYEIMELNYQEIDMFNALYPHETILGFTPESNGQISLF